MPKSSILGAACLALLLANPAYAETRGELEQSEIASDAALKSAIAADWRLQDTARDQYRHPFETIRFFQIEPGMTVVDFAPGTWYAKILIPYLGAEGSYVGALHVFEDIAERLQAQQRAFPESYPKQIEELKAQAGIEGGAKVDAITNLTDSTELEGTVDRIVIFRFMHTLYGRGVIFDEFTKFRKLLKDDGLLGIVQHRAKPNAPYSYANGSKGYLRQEDVIKLVEAHGFELVATSEINANPKDSADHAGGVWQLPPTWTSKDEAKKQIGESDRMTLLFRKRP